MKNETVISCVMAALVLLIVFGICFLFDKKEEKEIVGNGEEEIETKDNRIFGENYEKAKELVNVLTLEEKIGQLFLVRYPESNQVQILEKYKFGGYIFFERDFKNKTKDEVKSEIANLQNHANIPLLIAVDEEGGKVVRISSNKNLAEEKFKSPSELYNEGGFDKIKEDTIEKSNLLYDLGINLNLAPVVDIAGSVFDYIYPRTLGKDTDLTSTYAKTVIEASKESKVSYTLKHFPGYGSNKDTHNGIAISNKLYEGIVKNDLPPFEARNKSWSRSYYGKP